MFYFEHLASKGHLELKTPSPLTKCHQAISASLFFLENPKSKNPKKDMLSKGVM